MGSEWNFIPMKFPSKPIRLDTNENPFGPSPRAILAYYKTTMRLNRYPDYADYKEFISSHLGLQPVEVLPTPGSDRGIQVLLQCLSKKYERVVIPSPAFLMYTRFSRLFFNRVEQTPAWLGRSWDTVFSLSDSNAVLLLGSPNNPTGEAVEESILRRLLEEFGMVIVDEAYTEYYGKSFIPLLRDFSNLVLVRTFSKAYGLAGLRSGYLLGESSFLREVEKAMGPFDVPAPAVEASKAALEDKEWLRMIVESTSFNKAYMIDALNRLDGVKTCDSKANYVPVYVEDAQRIFEKLLAENIRVRSVTSEWGGIEKSFLRVTVGTMIELKYFLHVLRRVLAS
ncbi:MAG: aminotransferase class I/II-fold pyridoxal phosphate-dependent enzyme [Thaumarchaeota archaeon]|nr:aminotransferase class I/II-fold pyridoxal phosphate-dependent enzyme [Nitrososphaerota archaeon]